MDMGVVPGSVVTMIRTAPLGDPIEIRIKGFFLSLRKEEATGVEVTAIRTGNQETDNRSNETKQTTVYTDTPERRKTKRPEENKTILVALTGNPNSGKTSLFNTLVGAHQRVGNFSGVTIEKSEGQFLWKGFTVKIVDLPGTYSLTAYSPEELLTRQFLLRENPDLVLNVVDGTNLERNLYLTTQLMELDCEILIALNMIDEVRKNRIEIRDKQLQTLLGCHIVPVSAVTGEGLDSLKDHIVRVFKGDISVSRNKLGFSLGVEEILDEIMPLLKEPEAGQEIKIQSSRWEAIKLIEEDPEVLTEFTKTPLWEKIKNSLDSVKESYTVKFGKDPEMAITEDRNSFIRGALKETVQDGGDSRKTFTDRMDSLLLNRYLGLPIFLGIMWLMFQGTFTLGEYPMLGLEYLFGQLSYLATRFIPGGWVRDIITDGVISGVGGVLVFLPNILLLFFFISILEGTGYMARATFVVDRAMHLIGLHGKSFIPLITGFGCSVPAFMACRTLKNRADRLITMLIIPFISCSAKMPVYILLIRSFFPVKYAGTILFGIYLFGVLVAVMSAKMLKLTVFRQESEPFVMELPPYRFPTAKSLIYQIGHKSSMYVKKAGTLILASSVLIWLALHFPGYQESLNTKDIGISRMEGTFGIPSEKIEDLSRKIEVWSAQNNLENSAAAFIGKIVEPLFLPLGFDWRIDLALMAGLSAKEIVVSTLLTIYPDGLKEHKGFTVPVVLALIVFVLLYTPCLAATAVFHNEAGKWRWTLFYLFLTLATAWGWAFIVKHLSGLIMIL
jgi:ferrous iron transport protein B